MQIRYYTYILGILTLIAGIALYNISGKVHQLNKSIKKIERNISAEKHNIAVLKAEFSRLTSPDRIEKLARTYLPELRTAKSKQIIHDIADLDKILQEKTKSTETTPVKKLTKKQISSKKKKQKIAKKQKSIKSKPINSIEDLIQRTLFEDSRNISKTQNSAKR